MLKRRRTYKCPRIIGNDNVSRINKKKKLKINNGHSVEKKIIRQFSCTRNY